MADERHDPADEWLDGRLSRAGARWREHNTEPAAVDPVAVTAEPAAATDPGGPGITAASGVAGRSPGTGAPTAASVSAGAEPGGSVPVRVGGPTEGAGVPLPLMPGPRPGPPGRRRRARTWLAAAVAAAVVGGLTAGLVQLTGGSSSHHSPAADGPGAAASTVAGIGGDAAGAAVIGPDWQLRGMTGPDGTARPVAVPAHFRLDGSGLTFSDGCNSGGGQATVTGSTITFARLIHTTMACPSTQPGQLQQEQLIDAVLSGSVHWAVRAGQLTLSEPGVGALTYASAAAATTSAANRMMPFGGTWYLQTVQPGDNIAQPYGSAGSAPAGARIDWGPSGFTGFDGCNSFTADYWYVGGEPKVSEFAGELKVSDLVDTTTNPCPNSSQWTQILVGATHLASTDELLTIADAHGGILTFTRGATGASAAGTGSPSGAAGGS